MMHKISCIMLVVVLLFPTFTNFSHAQLASPEYQLYKNSQYGFSIEYPKAWNVVEHLDQKYVAKTIMISPDDNFQIHTGVIKNTNPYAGLTSQEILGQITSTMRDGCSKATLQTRGFTCTAPQFDANVTSYRGTPLYQVDMTWTKTFPNGQTIKWASVWGMIPSGNDVWLVIIESSSDEFLKYIEQSQHMYYSLDISAIQPISPNIVQDNTPPIPHWIKNTAQWWSNGSVTDDDFIKGIQYLIQQGIIVIPTTQASSTQSHAIPSWVKNTAKWWSEGQVTDTDFINGIQYLVQNGIISAQTQSSGIPNSSTFYVIKDAPQTITYTDKDGVTVSVKAIPGQVLLYVLPSSSQSDITQAVTDGKGTILSGVPSAGFYLVKVDNVQNFISSVLQKSFVIDAHPNFVLSSNQSPTTPIQIINYQIAPAKNPDPNAHVIIAVIDNFVGCGVLIEPPHGCKVISEIQSKTPQIPILAIQMGVSDGMTQYDVQWNIMRAIATAQENNQKVVINQSSGPELVDESGNPIPGAMEQYYNYVDSNLKFLSNLDWVQKNNVLYYQSAGNYGQDVSEAIDKLETKSPQSELYKNMYTLVGQMDKDTQKPMEYGSIQMKGSNYGKGVIYDDSTAACCTHGTSFTSPNLAAGAAAIWASNPNLSSSTLHGAIHDAATQNSKNGNPLFSPQGSYNLANKCLPNCPQVPYGNNQPSEIPVASQPSSANNQLPATADTGSGTTEPNPANEKKQLTTTISPAGDLTGHWSGSFSMKDTTSDGCTFSGRWEATMEQNGNDLSGSISITDASSPDYPANDFCTLAPGTFSFSGGSVSSSSFQFDSSDLGGFHTKGYFTTDLMHGNFNECSDESCATGTFTGSRD